MASPLSAAASTAPPSITTLRSATQSTSLRDQLSSSLRDGQFCTFSASPYAHSRSITTMVLYTDRGLQIYDEITRARAYYPFEAEKEILQTHGDEIAARMFGLAVQDSPPSGNDSDEEQQQQQQDVHHGPSPAANGAPLKEKWGDAVVGQHNDGVNGSANDLALNIGLAVELGSGPLDKTRLLLRSLSKILKRPDGPDAIDYKALDLERASLVSSLSSLVEQEPDSVKVSADASPRVQVAGLHADYWEGLAHLKDDRDSEQGSPASRTSELSSSPTDVLSSGGSDSSGSTSPSSFASVPEQKKTTSILWLGSSVGNFDRKEAVDFLKNVNLAPGDTMLIGIDNCNDKAKIEEAYNDPRGVTRRFILEGIDHAGEVLHGKLDGAGGLKSTNFDYVSRYNQELGRHEAYVRCKVDGLEIPLPATDELPATTVTLKKDELIHMEVSYKYTHAEAQTLFHASGFRLIQQWSDSQNLHTVYLLEQPAVLFPSNSPLMKEVGVTVPSNPYGLPSMDEWDQMWRTWDMLTLEIFPRSLLHTKPIPLRHIPLFYLGHIPAFRDIHISRYFQEDLTAPANFADIFERGIDPDCEEPSKVNHWHSEVPEEGKWPSVEEVVAYEASVRERVRKVYQQEEGKWTRRLARVMMMVFEHEAMHYETLIYIALQACTSLNSPAGFSIPDFPSLSRSWAQRIAARGPSRGQSILTFSSGTITLGHDDSEADDESATYDPAHEYGWDVENPKREVAFGEFNIDALPVTNGEYLAWMRKEGKGAESEWFPASWAWKGKKGVEVRKEDVRIKTLYGEVEMQWAEEWPLSGSAVQLEAFAKSKGGRLPTRDELAVFFRANPVDAPTSNVGLANLHPIPPSPPSKRRDGSLTGGSDGGVWMWSSTVLDAHEGYEPSALYPGYSSDFHDGKHLIICGASYATPNRLARPTFQNWYAKLYPFVLCGARVAY
ncbi:histidine-specific methyltransferase [Leucosporidium creatinivorum]|uniref:Histidine-specific methyltransferase n=1 Tax=Leucosporidium creatinivorum TaxID=106004 RepID=A0A1Y2FHN7_9BASI|nr:histidine-specific methyltransferase [Leucosporidium creatinivorum]